MANYFFDDEDFKKKDAEIEAEAEKARSTNQKLDIIGGLGDMLQGGRSFGDIYLGNNHKHTKASEIAGGMKADPEAILKRRQDLLDQYKAAKELRLNESRMLEEGRKNRQSEMLDQLKLQKGLMKQINPDTGEVEFLSAKEPKATQFQAANYGQRIEQAEKDFDNLKDSKYDPTSIKSAIQRIGFFPEALKEGQQKLQEQAERNFVTALLRKESGAAISDSEFKNAEAQYFPRVGDTPEVIAQKAKNRQIALASLKSEAGPAWEKVGTQLASMPVPTGGKRNGDLISSAVADEQGPHGPSVKQNGHVYFWNPKKKKYE